MSKNSQKINIYIDGNNLYRAARELGFIIDYKKFHGWLRQKYNPRFVYLFIGLVAERVKFYEYLQSCLVEFLQENKLLNRIIAPNERKCSILLKNKNTEITFLNSHYHKFSSKI